MLVWMLFVLLLIVISINDFVFFRIENEYVIALIALYCISCVVGISGGNAMFAAKVAIAVFAVTFVMNQFNLIGGGDVKLLVPLIMFAEHNLIDFLWGTSVGGFVIAVIYVCFRKSIFSLRQNVKQYLFAIKKKKFRILRLVLLSLFKIRKSTTMAEKYNADVWRQEIPYGVALACGGMCVVFDMMVR